MSGDAVPTGSIVKHRYTKSDRFVQVHRESVNDSSLSFGARGLLTYLLDKPSDWRWSADTVARETTNGRRAILAYSAELRSAGYMTVRKLRLPSGQFVTVHSVYERPDDNPDREPAAPECGNRTPVIRTPVSETPETNTSSTLSETDTERNDHPSEAMRADATTTARGLAGCRAAINKPLRDAAPEVFTSAVVDNAALVSERVPS